MFNGKYYKHQMGNNTACFIVGNADSGNFLQIITKDKVYQFEDYTNCKFSEKGIVINLKDIKGEIAYSNLTPLKSDIMGFFRFFPLQCKHSVESMYHDLSGGIDFEGKFIDYTGGRGYIEGDSGKSFPKKYFWIHCNDFDNKCSIMASIADIPFLALHFQGCICAIIFKEKEYRLATYKGVRIKELSEKRLILQQKNLRLEIDIDSKNFHPLKMPINGIMSAIVKESNSTSARFKFYENNELLFDFSSENTSFEYNY